MITQEQSSVKHLTEYVQWIAWDYQDTRKIPINPHTHRRAKPTDPATWSTYEQALAAANDGRHSGIGFVFSPHDPFTGIDLDNCVNAETGEISSQAAEIVERLDSYTEISPSGTGLKIWIRGEKPGQKCRTHNIEIYDRNRFFAFTGRVIRDVQIADRQHELNQLYKELFPPARSATKPAASNPVGEDEKLLEIARRERGGEFARLYDQGDTSRYDSASSADYRLCVKLVFYFGDDPARIERLFSGSALGQRAKWKAREDYRLRTIQAAIEAQPERYSPKHSKGLDVSELRTYASTAVWSGRGGPVDRAVYESVLDTVVLHGSQHQDGFTVSASERDLALKAGCDRKAVRRALRDLESKLNLIKRIRDGDGRKSATHLVRNISLRKAPHITSTTTVFNMGTLAHSLRNASPLQRKELVKDVKSGRTVSFSLDVPYIEQCIGKLGGLVLVKIAEHPNGITLKDLAKALGKRSNDLKRRQIPALLHAGLITMDGDLLHVTENVEERLEEHLKLSGCYERERLQRARNERQREAYRTRNQRPADPAPTEVEMEAERKIREVYEAADGHIEDLERHIADFDTFASPSHPQQPLSEGQERLLLLSKGWEAVN